MACVLGAILCIAGSAAWVASRNSPTQPVAPLVANYQPTDSQRRCGLAIVKDWFPDGCVDGRYTRECFDAALGLLPPHPLVYSNAADDIRAAYAKQVPASG